MKTAFGLKWAVVIAGAMLLVLAAACAGEKEIVTVVKEVVVEKEVVKEVPVEVVVEKEVVKEVAVERVVIKEVPVEKIVTEVVTKEVIKTVEVPVEKIVTEVVVKIVEVEKPVIVTERVVVEVEKQVLVEVSGRQPSGEVKVALASLSPFVGVESKGGTAGGHGLELQIYEGIIRAQLTPPGVPPSSEMYEPELASTWVVGHDFSKITFSIRKGIPWHDGWGELKAEDVVYTYNGAIESGSVSNAGEQIAAGHRLPWTLVDDYTAQMNIKPGEFDYTWGVWHGGLGWSGTFAIGCKHCHEALGDDKFMITPIGTGPFKAVKWVGNDEIKAEAVTGHWQNTPNIETLRVFEIPEQATREAALLTGEVDFSKISVKRLTQIVEDTGGTAVQMNFPFPQTIYMSGNYWAKFCPTCAEGEQDLVANPRPGYLPDADHPWIGRYGDDESMENARKVRWAMSMALDREKILRTVLQGFGEVAYTALHTQFPPGDPNFQEEWRVPFDPGLARQYMADAGYPDGFKVVFWSTNSVPEIWDPEIADAIASMWREHLNLDVTVDKSPYGSRRPETVTKEMDIPWMHGWGLPPGGSKASFFCPTPGHLAGVEMPKEICDVGYRNDTEPDLQKRIQNNIEFQNYMSYWHLNPAVVTLGSFVVHLPRIKEWHPYFQAEWNNPASIVLR